MRKYLVLIMMTCLLFFPIKSYGAVNSLTIKIGPTLRNGESVKISSDGSLSYDLENSFSNNALIQNSGGQAFVNGRPVSRIFTNGIYIEYKNNRYRGNLTLINRGTDIYICNQVNLDDYIKGVIPYEMSSSFPLEALKAQAIASRGFALSNRNKYIKYGYNLDDTTSSQVYKGMKAETSRTNQAVDQTTNIIPYYGSNYADTIFHATSGGYTVSADQAWGGQSIPYLVAKEDPYSVNTRNASWTYTLSYDKMKSIMESAYPEIGAFKNLSIAEKYDGRRVKSIRIEGDRGEKIIKGSKFRSLLGNTKVKSTWFTINGQDSMETNSDGFYVLSAKGLEKRKMIYTTAKDTRLASPTLTGKESSTSLNNTLPGSDFVIKGRGYGHGVGMSQYGAVEMAKQGKTYYEILMYYYPSIQLIGE